MINKRGTVLPTSSSDTNIASSRSRSGSSPQRTLVSRSRTKPNSHSKLAFDLLKFAGPLAISYDFTWMLVSMVFIIGHLDNENENNLPATPLITTMLNGLVMLLSAAFIAVYLEVNEKRADYKRAQSNPAVSQEVVEQKKQAIRAILPNSMALAMAAVPLVALPLYYSEDILVGFNQEAAVAAAAQDYLRPYAIGGSSVLLRFILEQYALGYEKQRLAMAVGVASLAIGSGAAYALGQYKGMAGVAWGYNISALLALSGFAAIVGYSSELKNFKLLSSVLDYKSIDPLVMKGIALKGLSFIMILASEMVSSFALAMMAGNLGTNQLAVQNMVAQLSFFGLIPIFAMSQAISGAVSTQKGAKNYQNMSRLAWVGPLTTSAIMLVPCSVVFANPQLLVAATNTSGLEVDEMANNVLRIQAATMLVDALRQSMLNALRAAGDYAIPTTYTIVTLLLGLGTAYALGLHTDLGIDGIALGYAIGVGLGATGLMVRSCKKMNETALSLAEPIDTQSPEVGTSPATEVRVSMVPFEEEPGTELTSPTADGKDSRVLFVGTRLLRSISPIQEEVKDQTKPRMNLAFPATAYLSSPTQDARAASVDTPGSVAPFLSGRSRSKTGGLLAGVVGRYATPRADRSMPSPIVPN